MNQNKLEDLEETKSAPKGFHFTRDGKLKRGDANRDGSGGPMLRSDPLDKQRSKIPPVSEAKFDLDMSHSKAIATARSSEPEMKHRVSVTVSDPQHTMVTKRGEKVEKRIRVSAKDQESAVTLAKNLYKKQGYKIHSAEHIGIVEAVDLEEAKYQKLSAQQKFKNSMKRAGYDMDAGAKRLQDLLAKQKKEREEREKQNVAEAGPFSYGVKPPRKGSVAYNAMMKRKEQEKNKKPSEPKDQMVGTAKLTKEDAELVNEAVTVKKANYSWGKMVTVHHGAETSYPLHPEHQAAIKNLKPGESTSFTDETNRKVTASREDNVVYLSGRGSNKKTAVAYSHFAEGAMNSFKQLRNKLEEKTLTPAEMKKREEVAKAIERENPNMPMGMKMAIATKTAKRVAEEEELDEAKAMKLMSNDELKKQHDEIEQKIKAKGGVSTNHPLVQKQRVIRTVLAMRKAKGITEEVDDEGNMARGQLMRMVNQASALAPMMDDYKQLDGWVQSKLTMASDYLDSVHDYLMHNRQDVDK